MFTVPSSRWAGLAPEKMMGVASAPCDSVQLVGSTADTLLHPFHVSHSTWLCAPTCHGGIVFKAGPVATGIYGHIRRRLEVPGELAGRAQPGRAQPHSQLVGSRRAANGKEADLSIAHTGPYLVNMNLNERDPCDPCGRVAHVWSIWPRGRYLLVLRSHDGFVQDTSDSDNQCLGCSTIR